MIRFNAVWIATEPMDMSAGTDTALARVVTVSSTACIQVTLVYL